MAKKEITVKEKPKNKNENENENMIANCIFDFNYT